MVVGRGMMERNKRHGAIKVLKSDTWNSIIFRLVEIGEDAVPSSH